MIALDTNILVYARRVECPHHREAKALLAGLAGGSSPWAIPWPCIYEFVRVVTHPKVFDPPTPQAEACKTLRGWLRAPSLRLLSELPGYWDVLDRLLHESRVVGPRIHDARIVALCLQHGVDTLWTADRDFSRFTGLRTSNPLHIK